MTPPIVPGKNGMSTVLLSHPSGSSADVYLNGAHVTSWIPAGGKEVLFMGKTATFAPGDPIRGGIPVVSPGKPSGGWRTTRSHRMIQRQ